MTRTFIRAAQAALFATTLAGLAYAQSTSTTPSKDTPMTAAPIVFFDIAGPDMAAQSGFYSKVFGWEIAPAGQLTVPVTASPAGLMGTLRAEPKEAMLYMGVEDIPGTLAKVVEHGGKIVAPRFEVPGVVVLGLFTDPAGNRMGLVEMKDGRATVP